jgi:hypothetical protein
VLSCVPGDASFVPPQHASVLSQNEPVILQPPAGWQTFVPLPRSTHLRVQQFESLVHGTPSCVQPPSGALQRPGEPSPSAVQSPEQQSCGRRQMSPGALQ